MVKVLALFGALFTGGTVALNTEVDETTEETTEETVEEVVKPKRHKKHNLEEIKETGFPYPSEEFLATLTEDQLLALTTYIDEVNLNYDFSNMTDDELKEALGEVKDGMKALFEEQGIELPERPEKADRPKGPRGGKRGMKPEEQPVEETDAPDAA